MIKKILYSQYLKLLKPKFNLTAQNYSGKFDLLDIGVANNSYRQSKVVFPSCRYTGLDIENDLIEYSDEDKFIICDLEKVDPSILLTEKFDLIFINHVIEHLDNGEIVLDRLYKMLNPGGMIFVEWPSEKTLLKKKTAFNYHFHDDPTHKKLYDISTVANVFLANKGIIISAGPISTTFRNLISPFLAVLRILIKKNPGPLLIHTRGYINHVLACKSQTRNEFQKL